jgi:glutathione synthase/RimK-type ligase-like ATP-grasp enzyme
MKKVLLSVLPKNENKGFISSLEIKKLEKLLVEDNQIKFLGNIDLENVSLFENNLFKNSNLIEKPDLFFWYSRGVIKKLDLLKAFSNEFKVVKNPESLQIIQDKFLAHSYLQKHNLPVPKFALVDSMDFDIMKKILEDWKTVLVKPQKGSFGRGIVKISDFETLRDLAGIMKAKNKQDKIFVEKFYPNDINEWISTTVINRKAVYGYRKKEAQFADWKVYDPSARGGGAYYVDPSPVKSIAEKAASCLGADIVGFDFIKTDQGYILVDENNFPGMYENAFDKAGEDVSLSFFNLIKAHL